MLAPHPVAEIADAAHAVGATVLFDAAHVAGLVAGGSFQSPLAEGADVMTCSTYKSFGGPPGGLVLCDDERIAEAVDRAVYPGLTANYDASRLAALCVAEAEVLAFWGGYAEACIANARALADGLVGEGSRGRQRPFVHRFTSRGGGRRRPGRGGWRSPDAWRPRASCRARSGCRATRTSNDPRASGWGRRRSPGGVWDRRRWRWWRPLMGDVVLRGAPPAPIATAVRELRAGFTTVGYCFA